MSNLKVLITWDLKKNRWEEIKRILRESKHCIAPQNEVLKNKLLHTAHINSYWNTVLQLMQWGMHMQHSHWHQNKTILTIKHSKYIVQNLRKKIYAVTVRGGMSGLFSFGWIGKWPQGAFPTKYVRESSPRTDSNADSAHCNQLDPNVKVDRKIRTQWW